MEWRRVASNERLFAEVNSSSEGGSLLSIDDSPTLTCPPVVIQMQSVRFEEGDEFCMSQQANLSPF
ncbi:MAG: hypothetical protein LBL45_09990 [Treponema sp.]|jgi:hypothetical protein|nr:hypothetical protein [Treponema sp.]